MVSLTLAGLGAAWAAAEGEAAATGEAPGEAAGEAAGLAAGLGEAIGEGLGDAAGEAAGLAAGAVVGAAGAVVGAACWPPPHAAVRLAIRTSAMPMDKRTHVMPNKTLKVALPFPGGDLRASRRQIG